MRFRWLAFGGAVWMVAAGCSASDPVVPSATVQTEIPLGQREVTTTQVPETTIAVTSVASTSVAAEETIPPTTRLRPAVVGPSPSDLEALFAATLLADQVLRVESDLPAAQRSRERLLKVMTARVADPVLAGFAAFDARNRRYQAGSIEERVVLRMENYSSRDGSAEVILCFRNNAAEFDTKGTVDPADDLLIQEDLATKAFRTQMLLVNGVWKRNAVIREKDEQCSNAF